MSGAGQVTHVHIGTDRETGRSRGFAFVEFSNDIEAAEAIRRFDGYEIDGRKLRVNTADDRPRRPGGPNFGPPRGDAAMAPHAAMEARVPWGGGFGPDALGKGKQFKSKGSRRRVRARKRSLNF